MQRPCTARVQAGDNGVQRNTGVQHHLDPDQPVAPPACFRDTHPHSPGTAYAVGQDRLDIIQPVPPIRPQLHCEIAPHPVPGECGNASSSDSHDTTSCLSARFTVRGWEGL